jgi:mRNA interferase RelE/StbE
MSSVKVYKVEFSLRAGRQIKKLNPDIRTDILRAILGLETNPRPAGVKKLIGFRQTWRIRVRDYRIIYDVFDNRSVVEVIEVGHRRSVYRGF